MPSTLSPLRDFLANLLCPGTYPSSPPGILPCILPGILCHRIRKSFPGTRCVPETNISRICYLPGTILKIFHLNAVHPHDNTVNSTLQMRKIRHKCWQSEITFTQALGRTVGIWAGPAGAVTLPQALLTLSPSPHLQLGSLNYYPPLRSVQFFSVLLEWGSADSCVPAAFLGPGATFGVHRFPMVYNIKINGRRESGNINQV